MKKNVLFVSGLLLCGAGVLYSATAESFDELSPESVAGLTARTLERVLDANPDFLHERCGERGWTPLHYAKVGNRPEVVEMLVQHGALVNAAAKDPGEVKPIDTVETQYTQDPRDQHEIQLYLALSGAQVDDKLECFWKRRHKRSLKGLQKEYREHQQKAIVEVAGFPQVLAALVLDYEKGEEGKAQSAAAPDGSEKSEES